MPWARRFRELGVVGKKELGELEKIDLVPREPACRRWSNGRRTTAPK